MLALELIDSDLALAVTRGDSIDIAPASPGIAVLEDSGTLTGVDAARRIRLKPLLAHTNFWRGLSTDQLTRPSRLARTTADLAFAHATAILSKYQSETGGVLLAVPAGYSREQLGLLLGIVGETGVPVAGLVDAGLAACSIDAAPARVLHLDLELHQALLTVLEASGADKGLKRSRYEIAQRHGLNAIHQSWMQLIAEQFVRKTRFDPLHEASSEQRLVDELPTWIRELTERHTLTISMQFGERQLEVEVERSQFVAAAELHYAELQRLVQDARVAGMPIELRVSQRVAALPGLIDRLAGLRDCQVSVLPHAAAAIGALQYEAAIRRPADSLALVYQLPTPRAASVAAVSTPEATPTQLRPTHLLYQGRAWAISDRPLAIGWSIDAGKRALTLPSASPGVSRSHCSVVRKNGSVMIEDHSTYGSYVNDERVVGHTALTVGDRLRLGSPGVTLELIQLVKDDGAPQD
jgi:hypothetical protein